MVVAPRLSDEQAIVVLARVYHSTPKLRHFLRTVQFLHEHNYLRLRLQHPVINHANAFSDTMDDATSRFLYRFTVPQLRVLCVALHLPSTVMTSSRDYVPCIEALAMTCRRLAEPCRMLFCVNAINVTLASSMLLEHPLLRALDLLMAPDITLAVPARGSAVSHTKTSNALVTMATRVAIV
ncbi:hypothetical protein H257_06100 [Aphanomyces astaci]|uniref:Uncharacterized protein n=1 Tax=Aphanomyces astaci TaxID=112090 RepID=W4GMK9_APHAT|nr:hypothetical protein H257_06100 [Aphanomyces astaci]ETV80571.1 hypothetical protein H257_06100 [Aphanomyces astaci]|eukprot:XP_009829518.1 hypothetical protein H257_06100 [Aphanomyces astaci]